jgi:hypothetical protein
VFGYPVRSITRNGAELIAARKHCIGTLAGDALSYIQTGHERSKQWLGFGFPSGKASFSRHLRAPVHRTLTAEGNSHGTRKYQIQLGLVTAVSLAGKLTLDLGAGPDRTLRFGARFDSAIQVDSMLTLCPYSAVVHRCQVSDPGYPRRRLGTDELVVESWLGFS